MRLVLLGPPGAGKGTQAGLLAERFDVPHVATGDLLRAAVAAKTPLGLEAKKYMGAGELVPDELVLEMLRGRLEQADARRGFVFDGFPRNRAQAEALDQMLDDIGRQVDNVIAIDVPDDVIVTRLSQRWTCPACGRVYNMASSPPKMAGFCDADGTPLVQRDDDKPDVIQRRLDIFHAQTQPLVQYYLRHGVLKRVNGVGATDEVTARILTALGGVRTVGSGA